jgi:hypothetical protein
MKDRFSRRDFLKLAGYEGAALSMLAVDPNIFKPKLKKSDFGQEIQAETPIEKANYWKDRISSLVGIEPKTMNDTLSEISNPKEELIWAEDNNIANCELKAKEYIETIPIIGCNPEERKIIIDGLSRYAEVFPAFMLCIPSRVRLIADPNPNDNSNWGARASSDALEINIKAFSANQNNLNEYRVFVFLDHESEHYFHKNWRKVTEYVPKDNVANYISAYYQAVSETLETYVSKSSEDASKLEVCQYGVVIDNPAMFSRSISIKLTDNLLTLGIVDSVSNEGNGVDDILNMWSIYRHKITSWFAGLNPEKKADILQKYPDIVSGAIAWFNLSNNYGSFYAEGSLTSIEHLFVGTEPELGDLDFDDLHINNLTKVKLENFSKVSPETTHTQLADYVSGVSNVRNKALTESIPSECGISCGVGVGILLGAAVGVSLRRKK